MMVNTFRCFGLSESKTVTIRIFGPSLDMKRSFGRRMSSPEKSFVPSTCYCSTSQSIHTLLYLERLVKAAKSRARAAMNKARSISTGPLVVAVKPKKIRIPASNIPKIALTTRSGRGCFVQFIRFFFLSSDV